MCGIFGRVNLQGKVLTSRDLQPMAKSMVHRGPDDTYYYLNSEFGFGANRLAIIDFAHGRQPLANENKSIWAVQNGEIYNYRELKEQLEKQGHSFRSESDTEILVHAFEEKKIDFVKDLRGMFALAIWDKSSKELYLARDRIGIKPLYYTLQPDCFLFASELKAILRYNIARKINRQALHDYLSLNYIPGKQTIFENVFKLPPGHYLQFRDGKITVAPFWSLASFSSEATDDSESSYLRQLKSLLTEAVRYHLISDVPVGAFLSGGLDSSAVVALAAQELGHKLHTFSVSFSTKSYDESRYAQIIAKKFGTNHEVIDLSLNIQDLTVKVASYFDEPFADSSAIPTFAISKAASRHVKVILSGDGGDEIFGGYEIYKADRLLSSYQRLPKALHHTLVYLTKELLPVSQQKMSFDFKIRRFLRGASSDPITAHFLWRAIFTEEEKKELYTDKVDVLPTVKYFQEVAKTYRRSDRLNALLYIDTIISLVDDMLTKVDRMSMANSLEVRVPLLDHKLVEFLASLPSSYKVRGLTLKYLFKQVLADILPREILRRPKAGFHAPVPLWIKGELLDLICEYLSASKLASYGNIFSPTVVAKLLKEHLEDRADWSRNLWGILMFQLWYENYLLRES